MFSPGKSSAQNSSSNLNSYNFFQSSVDSNRVIQPSQNKVISSDQARSMFSGKDPETRKKTYESMKAQGYTFEDEKATAPVQDQGYLDTAIQWVKDFSAGVSAAGTQAAGGALSIASDIVAAPFSDKVSYGGIFRGDNTGWPGQFFRDETKRQLAQGAESFGANTNNITYNVGKTGAGIWLAAVTPGGVLWAVGKEAGLLAKVWLNATQGAIETAKFNAITEGRIGTATELATGAAFGWALPIVGAGLGKVKDYVTTKLPESLIATGLATPSKLLNASERLNKLGDPSFQDATSVSKWLLWNKIAGDLEQRTTQLADLAKTSRESAQTLLKWNTTTVADDIALQAKKGLETLRTKLEWAGLDKYVSYIDDALAKWTWTAEDLNKARTFMADKGGIFKHSGDWVDSLQKENLQDIWKASSKYLDETIPWFRAANKDYEVASALGEAIKLKQAQDIGRQVFSLVNVTGAGLGGTIWGLTTGGDPMSILKWAALWVGWRYIFSPANMSKLALKLSEYAPKSEAGKIAKAIEAFVISRWGKEIPTKYVDIIKNASQATKLVKSTSLIKPTQAKTAWLKGALDLTKSNKGFINPTAMAEDLGLKAKDSTNALMEEARKYGSAEEFVNNKINFQHWWRVTIDEFGITKEMKTAREKFNKLQSERDKIVENSPYWKIDSKFKKRFDEIDKQLEQLDYDKRGRNIKEKWFYFTNDKEYLKTFNKWAVTDAFVDLKNPYIVKKWEIDLIEEAWYNEKTINKLEDQWYDGLIYNNGEQLLAFDKSSIKTKKQLTDIYNQSKALITK